MARGVGTRLRTVPAIRGVHDRERSVRPPSLRHATSGITLFLDLVATLTCQMTAATIGAALVGRAQEGLPAFDTGPHDEFAPPSAGVGDAAAVDAHRVVLDTQTLAEGNGGLACLSPGNGGVMLVGQGHSFRTHGVIIARQRCAAVRATLSRNHQEDTRAGSDAEPRCCSSFG